MTTKRDAAKENTRKLLLESARHQFQLNGFAGATVRDIAYGAGFSTGAIFGNWANKDEVFAAAYPDDYMVKKVAQAICLALGYNYVTCYIDNEAKWEEAARRALASTENGDL